MAATARDFFARYHLQVFRYLRRMTGSQDVAEELAQEVFVRVVRALPTYRSEGKDRAWVFSIARNLLLNRRRDHARAAETVEVDLDRHGDAADVAASLDVGEALARIPDTEREVFLLRELGGFSYEEIGEVCELTPDSVRSRIYRARMALRLLLAAELREAVGRAQGGSR